jgi:hypothetical protein
VVVEEAGDKIHGVVMAHEPGSMLVTDWRVEDLEEVGILIASILRVT